MGRMRWQGLFDDLQAQAVALELAERAGEVDERTRGEIGTLHWHDRVRAAVGLRLRIRLAGGASASGALVRVGPDWLLLDEGDGREVVVAASAVLAVRGLDRHSATPDSESAVSLRLGLRHVLRGIARDRSMVRVHLTDGSVIDATIDRVGADFADVATHGDGEVRRAQGVREVELLPFHALTAVRRTP
jgi:hypothetical protein